MNVVCGGLNGYRSSPTGAFLTARTLGFSLQFSVASCLKACNTRFADKHP